MVFRRQERHSTLMPDVRYIVRTTHTRTTTEIAVDREEFTAVRTLKARRGWCRQCAKNTSLVTAEEAAAALRVSLNTILEWCETGKLHFASTARCPSLVCLSVTKS